MFRLFVSKVDKGLFLKEAARHCAALAIYIFSSRNHNTKLHLAKICLHYFIQKNFPFHLFHSKLFHTKNSYTILCFTHLAKIQILHFILPANFRSYTKLPLCLAHALRSAAAGLAVVAYLPAAPKQSRGHASDICPG